MPPQPLTRLAPIVPALKSLLGGARERFGQRTIILAPDVSRGGNLLYSWAWAHTLNCLHGEGTALVEQNRHATLWLNEFPDLQPLTVDHQQIRLLDKRHTESLMYYGDPLTDANIRAFVKQRLLTSPTFAKRISRVRAAMGENPLVINVRRGDYYTDSSLTARYGIDVRKHVREALTLLGYQDVDKPHAFIISDNPHWCLTHLSDLANLHSVADGPGPGMFNDLAAIAVASQVVLANSTFSYWGQFISRGLGVQQQAVAPHGHERHVDTGHIVMNLLDPTWGRTTATPGL
ncbi:alpha-1,2-fucosyltransferase [Kocuria sp.]|uniref:alpha-1,2-fucosyltransferase n=1 Tax=Kocuria sp. TaxID=1871328 RepID=UPI0026E10B9E|nr:alpha-1,2-fucosyltransferase [Kocuria sp.]MDO5618397.1 alpha-1,2-fucosyltransferase [Kocuria sp.]